MPNRRDVIKALAAASGLACLAPFIPLGKFLTPESGTAPPRQKIANIEDIPIGTERFVVYPRSGDPARDKDPFKQFSVVRTGEREVVGYSRVCIHLWCLISLDKETGNTFQCPCHGSIYTVEDGFAIAGPAAKQPNRYLPKLLLEIDEAGDIYAVGVEGEIGYGR